ncbi:MAG: deoxyribodipyrimidine photo-lyase [Vulcanimicrobiaceae bacterium]
MTMTHRTSIVWFRRDLRLADNVALARAARESERVVCAFVLSPDLLRGGDVGAPIVAFFFDALGDLRANLRARGSDLALLEGDFAHELTALARRVDADALYYNVDYVPSARARDESVTAALRAHGLAVDASLDHVYYGADETLKPDGSPYTVFTPYKRRWLARHAEDPRPVADSLHAIEGKLVTREALGPAREVPEPEAFGHVRSDRYARGGETIARTTLESFLGARAADYADARNFPATPGTSHLSPHLRAGTIGIRTCVDAVLRARSDARGGRATGYDTWLSELVWRDFYQQILANYPHVATEPFLADAKRLVFRESDADFRAWTRGETGYPIVDAAMVQLHTYGWMHNRLRMIVASFFTKDLLLDYRAGERYFDTHLIDSEVAANNGGWQWSASTGTDAAPYFRVFNPTLQSQKFDPDGTFIKAMLPALAALDGDAVHAPWTLAPLEAASRGFVLGRDYPEPIVDHALARDRALATYAPVMGKAARVKT